MTNKYGIQKIPDVFQCTDYREKYWGWIKTCTATEDFTLKHKGLGLLHKIILAVS